MHILKSAVAVFLLAGALLFGSLPDRPARGAGLGGDVRSLIVAAEPVAGSAVIDADLAGRPVIVTFFASWCPPCTDEFKVLNQVRARYGEEQVSIVALNVFETFGGTENPARMARFLNRTMPQFHVVRGSPELRALLGGVERIPTLIVYDTQGREAWRFVHERDAEKMSATLDDITAALESVLAR